MAESNGSWGELVANEPELAEHWDSFASLPDAGESAVFDAFLEAKNLTVGSLIRLGAKLAQHDTICFAYPKGLKYRNIVTGRRWSSTGARFPEMKIIRHSSGINENNAVLVVEGETDGARCTILYPGLDIAVMPGGALFFTEQYAGQLLPYSNIYVGLDNDEAGDTGAQAILDRVPRSARLRPTGNDWCETPEPVDLPEIDEPLPELVPAGQLLQLEVPAVASWFENDLLPIGGLMVIHGWAKSYKTFSGIDIVSAIAECRDWCCFDPTEEPAKVAIIQFELPWAYYRQRIAAQVEQARDSELVKSNLFTFTPLRRPQLTAGNSAQEEHVLKTLMDAGIQVVLIDPIRRASGVADLNSESEVRPMLNFFSRLNDEGITVIFTHHDNKEGAKAGGGSPLSMTGSGAFAGDADTIVSVSLPKGHKLSESVQRNMHFTLRNSPAIPPRGMEMTEHGLIYQREAWGPDDDEAAEEVANQMPFSEPPI